MDRVPESPVDELERWIAYERDAEWAAKLAVLRARDLDEIAYFGACVREHARHADELTQLVKAIDPKREVSKEPTFVTRDAWVVGDVGEGHAILGVAAKLELGRIARYGQRARGYSVLDALLERHLQDARARLAALSDLSAAHHVPRVVAA
jgi:hypothetical protein